MIYKIGNDNYIKQLFIFPQGKSLVRSLVNGVVYIVDDISVYPQASIDERDMASRFIPAYNCVRFIAEGGYRMLGTDVWYTGFKLNRYGAFCAWRGRPDFPILFKLESLNTHFEVRRDIALLI